MATILVLRNDDATGGVLSEMLEKLQHTVIEIDSVKKTISHCAGGAVDLFIIDHQGESRLAIDALTSLKSDKNLSMIPAIVVTATARSDEVIEVMRLGAFDHLSKPLLVNELTATIERAIATPKQQFLNTANESQLDDFLVGLSPVMRHVEKLIGIAAGCDAMVLVQGETGTGKDTVARTIHRHSRHQKGPLTVVDCTAVPEDYESFHSLAPGAQGTVVLDEIGDLNAQMQAMLVRALKEVPPGAVIQPRIIVTTQYDLIAMVKDKLFREDLFYRLNVLPILLPPLRERGSDILSLAETFLQQARPQAPKCLSSSSAKQLLDYAWPGNVRELQNLMYHLTVAVQAKVIEVADLRMLTSAKHGSEEAVNEEKSMDYYSAMSALEKRLLTKALQAANGSRAEAARLLGINRQLLYSKLKAHGMMN